MTDAEQRQVQAVQDEAVIFKSLLDGFGSGPAFRLAKTSIEQAVEWATKGITNAPMHRPIDELIDTFRGDGSDL